MATLGNDIFGYKRNPKPKGVFSSENSKLFIGASDGQVAREGYLIQAWSASYSQSVEELFELGSSRIYWQKGRPQGTGQIGRVVGYAAADTDTVGIFPADAFDVCKGGATIYIQATGAHCDEGVAGEQAMNKGVDLVMSGVVITTFGFAMQVGDVKLQESIGWRFAHFEVKQGT